MSNQNTSILDNDLYKFTMQQSVRQHYPNAQVVYEFTNRNKQLQLNGEAVEWLERRIKDMAQLRLTQEEKAYLSQLSFLSKDYVDYLADFHFRPDDQIQLHFDRNTGDLDLLVVGVWYETILYEVPLLSLISEAYFRFVDRDWNYDNQEEQAYAKAMALLKNGCTFSEFGTRRRRDFTTQDIVMKAFKKASDDFDPTTVEHPGQFNGTSNVFFAKKYDTIPIGTLAHEYFMGVSALEGVQHANRKTLERWYETYKGALGIALTDTFTTPVFLKDFTADLAAKYTGVRQDSGSAEDFIPTMVNHFNSLGIDPKSKVLVFSDSLDVDRAIRLQHLAAKNGARASFGIGTSFTNDYAKASASLQKSKPMNIVIKLKECNGKRVIKLSDDALKYSADVETIKKFKQELGIPIE